MSASQNCQQPHALRPSLGPPEPAIRSPRRKRVRFQQPDPMWPWLYEQLATAPDDLPAAAARRIGASLAGLE